MDLLFLTEEQIAFFDGIMRQHSDSIPSERIFGVFPIGKLCACLDALGFPNLTLPRIADVLEKRWTHCTSVDYLTGNELLLLVKYLHEDGNFSEISGGSVSRPRLEFLETHQLTRQRAAASATAVAAAAAASSSSSPEELITNEIMSTLKVLSPAEITDDAACCICLCEMRDYTESARTTNPLIVELACAHRYHYACLEGFVRQKARDMSDVCLCPSCRAVVSDKTKAPERRARVNVRVRYASSFLVAAFRSVDPADTGLVDGGIARDILFHYLVGTDNELTGADLDAHISHGVELWISDNASSATDSVAASSGSSCVCSSSSRSSGVKLSYCELLRSITHVDFELPSKSARSSPIRHFCIEVDRIERKRRQLQAEIGRLKEKMEEMKSAESPERLNNELLAAETASSVAAAADAAQAQREQRHREQQRLHHFVWNEEYSARGRCADAEQTDRMSIGAMLRQDTERLLRHRTRAAVASVKQESLAAPGRTHCNGNDDDDDGELPVRVSTRSTTSDVVSAAVLTRYDRLAGAHLTAQQPPVVDRACFAGGNTSRIVLPTTRSVTVGSASQSQPAQAASLPAAAKASAAAASIVPQPARGGKWVPKYNIGW